MKPAGMEPLKHLPYYGSFELTLPDRDPISSILIVADGYKPRHIYTNKKRQLDVGRYYKIKLTKKKI